MKTQHEKIANKLIEYPVSIEKCIKATKDLSKKGALQVLNVYFDRACRKIYDLNAQHFNLIPLLLLEQASDAADDIKALAQAIIDRDVQYD